MTSDELNERNREWQDWLHSYTSYHERQFENVRGDIHFGFDAGYERGERNQQQKIADAEAALAECERLRQDLAKQFVDMQAYAGHLERKLAECERKLAEHPRIVANRYCCCCGKVVVTEAGEQERKGEL